MGRIEREMRKTESIRQNEEEFISWVTRELSIIEVDDPDLPQSLKEKYIQLCKARGIPYDEDLEALGELFAAKVQIVVEQAADQYAVDQSLKMHVQQPINMQEDPHNDQKDPNIDHKTMYKTLRKQRSPSDEADRQEYREKVKTLDTAQDLNWAIERLNGLQ